MVKKVFISHRGNISGPNPERENTPDYICEALDAGYFVEVDVWFVDGEWFLGHDGPQHKTHLAFLRMPGLWLHCKNIEAVDILLKYRANIPIGDFIAPNIHFFWHQYDDMTMTSSGVPWIYPGKTIPGWSAIAVLPEKVPGWDISQAGGICSDYIERYKCGF
jgi:hypothetical protein